MRTPEGVRLGRGNSQSKGPGAGMCLASLRNVFEEEGVAGTNEGDSGRRGAWRDKGGPAHVGTYRAL